MNHRIETPFDLQPDMRICIGTVALEDDIITVSIGNETLLTLDVHNLLELEINTFTGCGLLLAKQKCGEEKILCRFTMSCFKSSGDFCKVVNHYINTGVLSDMKQPKYCEKCGKKIIEELGFCTFCISSKAVIGRMWQQVAQYKKPLIVSSLFLVLNSVLFLSVAVLNRILVDRYLVNQNGTVEQIILMAAAMFLARGLGELVFIVSSRYFNRAALGFVTDLRTAVFSKIQDMPLNSVNKRSHGDLIKRIQNDTQIVKNFLTDMGRFSVQQVVMFFISLVILLLTNWKMTLLVFIPMPFVLYFFSKFRRSMFIRYERQWRSQSKCQTILHDILKGIRVVKAFGNEKLEIDKFKAENKRYAEISMENERLWSILFPANSFFASIGQYLILLFGSWAILHGTFTMGEMLQFTMFIGFIYGPMRWLVSFPRWLAEALTSMIKIFEVIDEPDEMPDTKAEIVPLDGAITFDSVFFGYKSYEPILKGISFEIKPGEMIGIVGRSGVGKSTLINLVMRLYDVNSGHVKIGDTDIRDISQKHLHDNIGVVFQENFLFVGTILDNIKITKPDATYEEVIFAAKAANAHGFIVKLPDGYHTQVGENGYSLSGGERQRISIARAIIRDPQILILDEATASLDLETEKLIQDSLAKIVKGRTTIAIAHRLSTLRNADRLIVIDKGKIAEHGSHNELMRQKGIYYGLIMAQRKTQAVKKAVG